MKHKIQCPQCNGRGMVIPKEKINENPSIGFEQKLCDECAGEGALYISDLMLKSTPYKLP